MGLNMKPHRPWFKVIINTFLRFFQPFRRRKFVLASIMYGDIVLRYEFTRVYHHNIFELILLTS